MLVAESAVVAVAGVGARVFRAEWVTYVIGPDAMVVIVDAGLRPGMDAVRSRRELSLISPFPFDEREWPSQVPTEVFARLAGGCLPLGVVEPAPVLADFFAGADGGRLGPGERGRDRPDGTRIHSWVFAEPMPFEIWDLVRGVRFDEYAAAWGDLRWLDLVPHDRTAAVEAFIAGWYADVPVLPYGPVRSDPRVPDPLRAFYRAVAGRRELLGREAEIFTSEGLWSQEPDGWIVFGAAHQGVFHWIMEPSGPDPAVGYLEGYDPVEPEPMSGFLLQFCLAEAAMAGPVVAYAEVDPVEAAVLTDRLRPVPLRPAGWLGGGRFHVAPGLVVMVADGMSDEAGKRTVWMSSRHSSFFWPRHEVDLPWQQHED